MSQYDFIKEIAKYGLENDQEQLLVKLNELIEYSRKTKKVNFAIQLQSILKEALRKQGSKGLTKVGSDSYYNRISEKELEDIILEKLTSDYSLKNIITTKSVHNQLVQFIEEHKNVELLRKYDLPIANKLLFHGPSGCGKTLASYVIAGELKKMMIVVNLGAIVSSKLGETSKNIAKLFRRAVAEDCIIFFDEFDSLGKVRDYNQDHGEMKRVVNTILQLFDYLPQDSIVVAATNQKNMLDEALLRRFDLSVKFELPTLIEIKALVTSVMKKGNFSFDNKTKANKVIKECVGLSYYSIQKTLITSVKQSLLKSKKVTSLSPKVTSSIWLDYILEEKKSLSNAS